VSAWPARISEEEARSIFRAIVAAGHADGHRAWLVHDLARMRSRIAALREAFPRHALHTLAIKANPLVEVLREAVGAGAGLEAASFEEVELAAAAGCPPARVVFDSPAKTQEELARALSIGIAINADNLEELARIDALYSRVGSRSIIGLRLNPLVGSGRIASTSVGASESRFGLPYDSARDAILRAFAAHPWLKGLHVHVGSQGCALDQLVTAAERAIEVAGHVHAHLRTERVNRIDIGGGLPTSYDGEPAPTPADYADRLRARAPALFHSGLTLVTEFGRAIQAGCGFAASRIEYVKKHPLTAVVHFGADLFLRAAYRPGDWRHEMFVVDSRGEPKSGPTRTCAVTGPLCFAGDVLARERRLVAMVPGDWLVIRDAGAYTLGMWSRHCSRGMPLVLGHDVDRFRVLRKAESPADVVRFWSRDPRAR
jgi:diaminopimelate decarboxylase